MHQFNMQHIQCGV